MQPDAEQKCESYLTSALLTSPTNPEALSTLASLRISQSRLSDARSALTRSHEVWKSLPADDPLVPAYPNRLAFTRLLIECEMYDEAMEVLEGLQEEDDQVVDLWYMGGWCLWLIGQRMKEGEKVAGWEDDWRDIWATSRDWLMNCEKVSESWRPF